MVHGSHEGMRLRTPAESPRAEDSRQTAAWAAQAEYYRPPWGRKEEGSGTVTHTFRVVCEFDGEWTQERQILFAKKIEPRLKPLKSPL